MGSKLLSRQPIRIIIADDHALLRMGFISLLTNQPLFQVVAEAINGEQLIGLSRIHDPDIVLTDIKMPVMNGIEATRILTEQCPRTGVIALTMFNYGNAECRCKRICIKTCPPHRTAGSYNSSEQQAAFFLQFIQRNIKQAHCK
jgi:DNA-binding NarL/FixJ family response regulator